MTLPTSNIYDGYTCAVCGASVSNGAIHNCSGGTAKPYIPSYTYNFTPYFSVLERIAIALEKIVERMMK